jgi:hypothetical protein
MTLPSHLYARRTIHFWSRAFLCYPAGILRNVSSAPGPAVIDIDGIILPLLLPVISSVSLNAVSAEAEQLAGREVSYASFFRSLHHMPTHRRFVQSSEPQIDKLSLKGGPGSDHRSEIELALEKLEDQLRTVQLALEILTGVCATLPDPDVDTAANADEDDAAEGKFYIVFQRLVFSRIGFR